MDPQALTYTPGVVPTAAELLADLDRLASGLAVPERDVSERTRAAYASDWRRWEDWCATHEVEPLPVEPSLVRLYVTDLAFDASRFKAATIERHLASLAWHSRRAGGVHDLARHPLVAPVLTGIRARRTERPRSVRPLPPETVARLVAAMRHHTWPDGARAARDTLTLLLGSQVALHRSQVVALSVADALNLDELTPSEPVSCLPCARLRWLRLLTAPDRAAAMTLVFDTPPPARWAHLCADPPPPGLDADSPLLRSISKDGTISTSGMSATAVNHALKRRLTQAGLAASRYGFGSLRAGAPDRL